MDPTVDSGEGGGQDKSSLWVAGYNQTKSTLLKMNQHFRSVVYRYMASGNTKH